MLDRRFPPSGLATAAELLGDRFMTIDNPPGDAGARGEKKETAVARDGRAMEYTRLAERLLDVVLSRL